jgi:hypothetical protein
MTNRTRSPEDQARFDGLFDRFKDQPQNPQIDPALRARQIGSTFTFNNAQGDTTQQNPALPGHLVTRATTIANGISADINDVFQEIQQQPTLKNSKIEYKRSSYERNGIGAYNFDWKNRKREFDMDSKDAKEVAKKITDINFEYIQDPKKPNEDSILQFKFKDKIASDSQKLTDLLNQIDAITWVKAKDEKGVYTIRYSSSDIINKEVEKLKNAESDENKNLIKTIEEKFTANDNVKEILKKTNENLKVKIETAKNIAINVIREPNKTLLSNNFNEQLAIEQRIAKLSLLRQVLSNSTGELSTNFDSILKEIIIDHGAKALFGKMSDLFNVIGEAAGVNKGEFADFIREQFKSYNNSSIDPLVAKVKEKMSEADFSLIKNSVLSGIDAQLTEQQNKLEQNLQKTREITNQAQPIMRQNQEGSRSRSSLASL